MLPNLDDIKPFKELISPEQKAELERSLQAIPILRENLRKTARMGIDITEQEKELNATEDKIRKLLAEL